MTGYLRSELVGHMIEMLVPEATRAGHRQHRHDYLSTGQGVRPMGTGLQISLRRKDRLEVPVDIALSPVETPTGQLVVAAIRDISERRRAQDRLEAVLEVSQAILSGDPADTVLQLIAHRARTLVEADAAMIATPGDQADQLVLRATDGLDAGDLRGMEVPLEGSTWGLVLAEGGPMLFDDLAADPRAFQPVMRKVDLGPALGVPLVAGGRVLGSLLLGNRHGGRPFAQSDLTLVLLFAAQAGVAVEYAHIREELQRLAVVEDRERIARELHDGAIQALFAVGMGLQAAAIVAADAGLRRRLEGAVAQIDEVIRDLRNYIFELRPAILGDRQFDQALRQLAAELEANEGVVAVVDIDPRVAEKLGPRTADVLQLAREALSNVGRHAQAQTCRLRLQGEGSNALLEVEDDGQGFDVQRVESSGHGLRNFQERAIRLGGSVTVLSEPGSGTTVRVLIPL